MFKCIKCSENKYLNLEEYLYICKDCNKTFQFCTDCEIYSFNKNNLEELKFIFKKIFRFIINVNYYLNQIYLLPIDLANNINKYLPGNILYYSIIDKKIYYFKDFPNEIIYIKPYGLQVKNDNNSNEFHTTPIFYCSKCVKKYDYFCLKYKKLIK